MHGLKWYKWPYYFTNEYKIIFQNVFGIQSAQLTATLILKLFKHRTLVHMARVITQVYLIHRNISASLEQNFREMLEQYETCTPGCTPQFSRILNFPGVCNERNRHSVNCSGGGANKYRIHIATQMLFRVISPINQMYLVTLGTILYTTRLTYTTSPMEIFGWINWRPVAAFLLN